MRGLFLAPPAGFFAFLDPIILVMIVALAWSLNKSRINYLPARSRKTYPTQLIIENLK